MTRSQRLAISSSCAIMAETNQADLPGELKYIQYEHSLEAQYLPAIRALISKDLSEPYSIYVYRYFLYQWGHLCFMVTSSLTRLRRLVRQSTRRPTS